MGLIIALLLLLNTSVSPVESDKKPVIKIKKTDQKVIIRQEGYELWDADSEERPGNKNI